MDFEWFVLGWFVGSFFLANVEVMAVLLLALTGQYAKVLVVPCDVLATLVACIALLGHIKANVMTSLRLQYDSANMSEMQVPQAKTLLQALNPLYSLPLRGFCWRLSQEGRYLRQVVMLEFLRK